MHLNNDGSIVKNRHLKRLREKGIKHAHKILFLLRIFPGNIKSNQNASSFTSELNATGFYNMALNY